jgi:hypothetical protein
MQKTRIFLLLSLVLILTIPACGTAQTAGEDWTRFRGENGSGVSASKGLPAEFGPEKTNARTTIKTFCNVLFRLTKA